MPSVQVKDAAGATQTVQTLPAVGQAPAAASLPVVLASDQGAVPVSIVADSVTVPVSLAAAVSTTPPVHASTNVDQIGGATLALGQAAKAASVPVTLASDQGALTVTGLPASLGQKTSAASTAVVLASDQPAVPVSLFGATTGRISYSAAIQSAATTPALAAPGVGLFSYVTDIDLFNASSVSVVVQLVNAASAVLWQALVPAGGGVCKALETPVGGNGQMAANTALSLVTSGTGLTLSAATPLYANLNGYKSAS